MDSFRVEELIVDILRYFWLLLYRKTSTFDKLLILELIHTTKTDKIFSAWILEASVEFNL